MDLSGREKLILVPMVVAILWLGVFPQPILDTSKRPVQEGLKFYEAQTKLPDKDQVHQTSVLNKKGGSYE
jgi:NADH-quinone oxidoreductase subunit M